MFVVVWIALLLLVVLVGILIANLGFFFCAIKIGVSNTWNLATVHIEGKQFYSPGMPCSMSP